MKIFIYIHGDNYQKIILYHWKDYYNREEDTMSRENFWRRDEDPEEKRQHQE